MPVLTKTGVTRLAWILTGFLVASGLIGTMLVGKNCIALPYRGMVAH